MNKKKIILIEFCNFEDYPIGGYVSFAKNLMITFKNDLILVGITTDTREPVGRWFKKNINGVTYDFFALARYKKSITKHFLPDRLVIYLLLNYYKKKLLQTRVQNIFIQRAEVLFAIHNFGFKNICFRFGGLENPLAISKYWYSRYIAKSFDKKFFSSIRDVKLFLAAGDEDAINKMIERGNNKIKIDQVVQFPTRIDTDIFRPMSKKEARRILDISESYTVISTTGRLGYLKGWKFMIDCFIEFNKNNPNLNCLFYFIGEGEDQSKIEEYILVNNLKGKVILAGKKTSKEIAVFLNASDLFIMGSYKEGWSTTLIEALACGIPICTTDFSSAKEIVTQEVTGYVIENRDVTVFADRMANGLLLKKESLPIPSEIRKYAVSELKSDLLRYWPLIDS